MREILFIAPYPNTFTIKDGMALRIKNVDMCFSSCKRIYLHISFAKHWKEEVLQISADIEVRRLNIFVHYLSILRTLFKFKNLYIHSLYNYFKLIFFIPFVKFKNKNLLVDLHGAVPDELMYLGKGVIGQLMRKFEKMMFRDASLLVYVTIAMQEYYDQLYPSLSEKKEVKKIVYPILNRLSFNKIHLTDLQNMKEKLNILDDEIIFLYSGNMQKWQNIDLILTTMNKYFNSNNVKAKFILLSGELDKLRMMVKKYSALTEERVILASVSPNELILYYQLAHYGFIVRDEHILNRVACPTKLIEYLDFGIVPIVKYACIGDFEALGYEYVKINELNAISSARKSSKNIEIIMKLREEINANNLNDYLV